jgi:hypothetical protein
VRLKCVPHHPHVMDAGTARRVARNDEHLQMFLSSNLWRGQRVTEPFDVLHRQDNSRDRVCAQTTVTATWRHTVKGAAFQRDLLRAAPTRQVSRPCSTFRQPCLRHCDSSRGRTSAAATEYPQTHTCDGCLHRTQALVTGLWVGTRACTWVCVGARGWRDPRLPQWLTGRPVMLRLPAHLTGTGRIHSSKSGWSLG